MDQKIGYARNTVRRLHRSNGVRAHGKKFRNWSCVIVACYLALQSCCQLHNAVFRYPPRTVDCPYYDARIIVDIYPSGYRDTVYYKKSRAR